MKQELQNSDKQVQFWNISKTHPQTKSVFNYNLGVFSQSYSNTHNTDIRNFSHESTALKLFRVHPAKKLFINH